MKSVKTVAMYLPQFHRTKENDAWWGEGFTEWTAVQSAKPLFHGHEQPRKPLHGNYYDLTEKSSLEWQADLAAKYGVDCLCFYHYWFGDGRLLLERPAENLLAWKDVNLPFCFCWANGTWARTWNTCGNWSWSPRFDKKYEDDSATVRENRGILIEQRYDDPRDWERHIAYLLPFFKDERYLKLDGRPVFVLYSPGAIYCLGDMLAFWEKRLQEEGIPGLHVVGQDEDAVSQVCHVDANLRLVNGGPSNEALRPYVHQRNDCALLTVDYDQLWRGYLAKKNNPLQTAYYCMTVSYDDTPRRGETGLIYQGGSPEKFGKYYQIMLRRSMAEGKRLLFINAWNEWGEGMYLEPDELHGYAYLEALQAAQKAVASAPEGGETNKAGYMDLVPYARELQQSLAHARRENQLLHRWMRLVQEGNRLETYLLQKGYRRISIYGMGLRGKQLYRTFQDSQIEVIYGIDRSEAAKAGDLPMYRPQDDLPAVDVIIVSVITQFVSIYDTLREKTEMPIVSLEEIIYEAAAMKQA